MLQKGFLRTQKTLKVSKRRFWWSIFVGLGASFSIYTFFCLMRLVFRTFDFGQANYALIIDEGERFWQNFYFALIALTLGNSLGLAAIFRRPLHSNIASYKIGQIMNNQFFLGFSFYHWFFKMFFLLGGFSISMMGIKDFAEIKYLLVLPALVIFLESWKSILRFYNRVAKLVLINFLVIVALAFGMASFSLFPLKKIDSFLSQNNPYADVPESKYTSARNHWREERLKIIKTGNTYSYNINGFETDFNGLSRHLADHTFRRYEVYRPGAVLVTASASTPIEEIKKLEMLLFFNHRQKVGYMVSEPHKELGRFERRYMYNNVMANASYLESFRENYSKILTKEALSMPLPPKFETEDYPQEDFFIFSNGFSFYGSSISEETLVDVFINLIDTETVVNFQVAKGAKYQNYITALSAYLQALEDLRANEETVAPVYDTYGYEILNKEEFEEDQIRVREKYPFLVIEFFSFD